MKETRRSLLTSVTALLLCFIMLTGSTFAWFTDIAASNNNVIQSGTLDIDLMKGTPTDNGGWQWTSTDGQAIFDYDKWEPGYTSTAVLAVQNNGTLSAKWTAKLELDGTPSILADVIEVYVTSYHNYSTDRPDFNDGTWQKLGTVRDVLDGDGLLLPGETIDPGHRQPILVAVHMRDDAGNDYQDMDLGANFNIKILATQASVESDSFDNTYDEGATWPELPSAGNSASANVQVDANGGLVSDTVIIGEGMTATVPAGTQLADGVTKLTLSVANKEQSDANITLTENEQLRALDVHISGVARANATPIAITLTEALPTGLNIGNYTLHHVENGQTVEMTLLSDGATPVHNDFKYDPATGDVTLYLASFSEVAMTATPAVWEGALDYSWYDANATYFEIANADQLAAFGAIVGGMKVVTDRVNNKYVYSEEVIQDSFKGKTVKLLADINLGDKESENNSNIIFYPIGYWNNEGTYERKPLEERTTAVESGFYNFCGTFDGNGHTVSNFYQNTWEMKGDHNWYDPIKEQYYRDGMGLFGKVYGGTVKNLTVKNFSSDGEITTTGVIAAYADGATFENIAIFNCNPRVYNIGNGGIVGCVGWYAKEAGLTTTFTNITVDNSNKISALWGSYDVACGGIVGQYYPTSGQTSAGTPKNAGIDFVNCHISAQMDVYNDVCANYQYYAYRYTGMLIGSVRENVTIDGHSYPKMDGITADNCTVHFGDWNDYYYCEIVANSLASYTHDHQFSRLTQVAAINGTTITYLDGTTGTVPSSGWAHYVVVKNKDNTTGKWIHGDGSDYATCYHFNNGEVWTHDKAGTETVNGVEGVLKEDKQLVYLEFNNLVTGYGWGVTSRGFHNLDGVTNLDISTGHEESVTKFESTVTELANNNTYKLSDIFNFVDKGVALVPGALAVGITNLDENNPVSATIVYDRNNWENSTITLTGTGEITITIQDYYFCTPTTITVNVTDRQPEVKFNVVMNNGDFLHRVGNSGTVALDKLFKAKDGVSVGTVSVTVEAVNGTSASGTYSNNAIQFNGTGVVKVTITDNDYCIPTELYLEVVDATNVTGLSGTLTGNVVLLNNCGLSSLTVSGRNTVYGNGFTATYSGTGQYLRNGLKQGVITVKDNGTLDNLRIIATIYPTAFMFTEEAQASTTPTYEGPNGTAYYYQLSAIAASGNATISNCYVYGARTNIFVDAGNVTISDTVTECGTLANIQIQSTSEYTVTLNNVTTIQKWVNATIGDTTKEMLGTGIIVGPDINSNPNIVLNGYFKQYNWVNEDDYDKMPSGTSKAIIETALKTTDVNHTVNGNKASNMGIIFLNNYGDRPIIDNIGLPYDYVTVSLMSETGMVYSLVGATAEQIYSDVENADRSTVNGLYKPQFKYPEDLGGQYIEKDSGDEHFYREGDTIYVLFPSGDTKEIDLAAIVNIVKYSGQNLNLVVTVKDENGNAVTVTNGKVNLSDAGNYTVTYTVTDTLFYDKDGNTVEGKETYSWNVTVSVSLKDTKIPDAYYEFDTSKQKMGYYKPTIGDVKQYIPFLAGLKIYDYNGQEAYLRFDGDNDYNKVASITVTNKYSGNDALVVVKLTDGGTITLQLLARADSGGGSDYTGAIKTKNNVIYFVNNGGTSNKDTTTTAAYWYVDYYKFTGNNGVEITSGQQKFTSTGSSASTPSGSFSTTIKYTVTYDANGGNCVQELGYATSVSAAVVLPTPSRSGYTFKGWYTAASGGTRVGGADDSYTPSANVTLYAQWGAPVTITFDANGGNCNVSSVTTGGNYKLPEPTKDGYDFFGWYEEDGTRIGGAGDSYSPDRDITLIAHWGNKYQVTYDANGGSCVTASATYQGTALTLPTPTREGYKFLGWYTSATGGTKIGDAGASYTPSANITLYAQWQINSYTIKVTTNNATVKVNGTTVNNNGTISIQFGAPVTVEVTYSQSNSRSTTITGADGKTYTSPFDMPAQNVTINATSSSSCVTPDTLVTLADGTQKRIDELQLTDKILAWDFFTGTYVEQDLSFIINHGESLYRIANLVFSDGTQLRVIGDHGIFDYDLNKFVYLSVDNMSEYIGHRFVKYADDGSYDIVTLTSAYETEEYTTAWSITSTYTSNAFASGLLTVGPPEDFYNWIEMDGKLHYDVEQFQKDVETYGLYTYEDFKDYLTYEQFVTWNGAYLKIAVEKGYFTFEYILELLEIHGDGII